MIQVKEKDIAYRKRYMSDSLPTYYDESPEANAIMRANATESEFKRAQADDLLNQLFVATATWGLDYWDRILGIDPAPRMIVGKRRERILVKLRGSAPATITNLTKILNVYAQNNDAFIVDLPSEYRFEGYIPTGDNFTLDIAEVYRAINEVKPAHLEFLLNALIGSVITLVSRVYSFDVPFKITNCFQTADVEGYISRIGIGLQDRSYSFIVPYPITNVMYPTGNGAVTASVITLSVETAIYYPGFVYAGEILLGQKKLIANPQYFGSLEYTGEAIAGEVTL